MQHPRMGRLPRRHRLPGGVVIAERNKGEGQRGRGATHDDVFVSGGPQAPLQQRDGVVVATEAREDAAEAQGGAVVFGVTLEPRFEQQAGLARVAELFVTARGIAQGAGVGKGPCGCQQLTTGQIDATDFAQPPGLCERTDQDVAKAAGDRLTDEALEGVDVVEGDRCADGANDVAGFVETLQSHAPLEDRFVQRARAPGLTMKTQCGGSGGVLTGCEQTRDLALELFGRRRCHLRDRCCRRRHRCAV